MYPTLDPHLEIGVKSISTWGRTLSEESTWHAIHTYYIDFVEKKIALEWDIPFAKIIANPVTLAIYAEALKNCIEISCHLYYIESFITR